MEVHQLRYFVAVADEGSFSRAAAKVRVAQPSLSQQIRKLEAEVGQPLFDRLPRSVVLTEAGRCLIDYARQILASIGDARRCVDELKGEVAGKVAVGAIPTIAPYVLPGLVVTFQKHYPDVILEIVEDVTDGITRRIEAGELDVAWHPVAEPSANSATRISGRRTIACAGARKTSPGKKGCRGIGRSQIAEISIAPRDALSVATGESSARVPSSSPGDRPGRKPAEHDRKHGRGLDRHFNCAANDGETPRHARVRQLAVCSAGPGAGTEFSIQSAPISEQGGRSVPSGSCGCLVCKGFVDHSCGQGMTTSYLILSSAIATSDSIGQTARTRITPKPASSGK